VAVLLFSASRHDDDVTDADFSIGACYNGGLPLYFSIQLTVQSDYAALVLMLSTALRRSATRFIARRTFAAAAGQQLSQMTAKLPHMDVVRYEHKNRTWSFHHTDYYSDALAIGLLEFGLQKGDVVLSFLPEHLSEQVRAIGMILNKRSSSKILVAFICKEFVSFHQFVRECDHDLTVFFLVIQMVLQFACSKAGFVLYTLPPSPNHEALAKALELTKANVLISQETGQDTNYITIVERAVPELRIFDTSDGMPFVTPRFPHLRMCVHTGFDQDDKEGWFALKHLLVPTGEKVGENLSDSTPLAGQLDVDAKGMPTKVGPTFTNAQVLSKGIWPTFSKVLKKEFHTVEGVGVIF
jgi:hypothetical protein